LKIQVQLFSTLRDCLPTEAERGRALVNMPPGANLQDMFDRLGVDRCLGSGKTFAQQIDSWQVSVNGEFTRDLSRALQDGDQVVVFPHMAGG